MRKDFNFEIVNKSCEFPLMRAGVIKTPHGEIKTPTFIVVGTHAEVKFLPPANLRKTGAQVMLSNGYHLLRRATVIDAAGGLAEFNGWHGPTFTDSGGFQVMSLGSGLGKIVSMDKKDKPRSGSFDATKKITKKNQTCVQAEIFNDEENLAQNLDSADKNQGVTGWEVSASDTALSARNAAIKNGKINESCEIAEDKKDAKLAFVFDDGVEFRDPYSSRIVKFTPEMSIATQHKIGADVMMAFDELTNIEDSYEYNVEALERTRKWAERSLREHVRQTNLRRGKPYQALYGCLQGAMFRDLREKAARDLAEMRVDDAEFDGFGLGGAFEKENLGEILAWMTQILPEEKPRHLLGLARPDDIFIGVENGADTFDCVAPTREARHGRIYTLCGNINLRRGEFAHDSSLLDADCDCATCAKNIGENLADYAADFNHNLENFAAENYNNSAANNLTDNGMEARNNFAENLYQEFNILPGEKFSRKTLRALLKSKNNDIRALAFTLLSQHNVRFVIRLTEQIRAAIIAGNYTEFKANFAAKYYGGKI